MMSQQQKQQQSATRNNNNDNNNPPSGCADATTTRSSGSSESVEAWTRKSSPTTPTSAADADDEDEEEEKKSPIAPPAMTLTESDYEQASLRSNDEYVEVESDKNDDDGDDDEDFFGGATETFGCAPPPPPPAFGRNNIFCTSYAGRPVGLQGPAHQAGELGLQWLTVMKSLEQSADSSGGWSDKIQIQKYRMEEIQQQQRQSYVEREAEKARMDRTDHRHALQQLVVEAFRWRRAPPTTVQELDAQQGPMEMSRTTLSLPNSHNESLTSPRTLKTVPSADLESLCGLTVEEDEDNNSSPRSPTATTATTTTVGPTPISNSSIVPAPAAPSAPTLLHTPRSEVSSATSTFSACNRQAWKKQFPLPQCVPPREKADHTTNPLDVADRAMLYGVLDDIDSVMTTSDMGDDGMPKDRYSEVLANLQFLGLFRPKYTEDVEYAEDEYETEISSMQHIDVGIVDDLDDDDLFGTPGCAGEESSAGIVEILHA